MKKLKTAPNLASGIDNLIDLMSKLRDPDGGCPWDLEQDFQSLAPYAIEEAYEVQDAAARNDMNHLKEELGDLLLQVVFHGQMAREQGLFDFNDIAQAVTDKMVSRHPHVFGDAEAGSADAVLAQWDDIKLKEKAQKPASESILDDVPLNLPALLRGQKLQKRAAKVGFDWATSEQVFAKIEEEINELKQEIISNSSSKNIEEEFGDTLFAFVNLGRKLGLDCELALTKCNQKFYRRFNGIEKEVKLKNKQMTDCTLEELDAIWDQQKLKEKAA